MYSLVVPSDTAHRCAVRFASVFECAMLLARPVLECAMLLAASHDHGQDHQAVQAARQA